MKYLKIFEQYNNFPNSKMRNKDGELTTYFHGVGRLGKFKEFDETMIGYTSGNSGHFGKGIYFTDSELGAKSFSEFYGGTGEVIKAHLDINNPFYVNEKNLIFIGEKYNLNLPKKVIVALDIKNLLKQLKPIDKVAYRLLYLLDKYNYERGWKIFLKRNKYKDSTIDLNIISDWYEETNSERYGSGVHDFTIQEMENVGITPKFIYDYNEDIRMDYLTDLGQSSEDWTNSIKKEGYDGIVAGDEYVVFDKSQINIID